LSKPSTTLVKPFFSYLLRCSDGSYYAGHTDDIDIRMRQHVDGQDGYTATRKPLELVWQGEFDTREGAIAFEQQIKGWSRAKKEALIRGEWDRIKELAKSSSAREQLRQAQPERSGESPGTIVRAEAFDRCTIADRADPAARPGLAEPVEELSTAQPRLRQAQAERSEGRI